MQSLNGGGAIKDLSNLTVINLSFNRFTRVPDELCNTLKNLRVSHFRSNCYKRNDASKRTHFSSVFFRFSFFLLCFGWQELFLSHNAIDILPASINKLTNLELLDISHNHLMQIDQIGFMPHLRILNITGNTNLTKLPAQLSTCDSLNDIVLDAKTISYPPVDIVERGTAEILKFLLEHNDAPLEETAMKITNKSATTIPIHCVKQTTANMLNVERGLDVVRELNIVNDKYSREKVCTTPAH